MDARILNIESKKRKNPVGIASPTDFHFSEGDTIDAEVLIKKSNISLYCLDHENQRALFVETHVGVDLFLAPFYYQAQMVKHFPDAKNLFLYRDAVTWSRSAARAFLKDDFNTVEYLAEMETKLKPLVPLIDKCVSETGSYLSIAKSQPSCGFQ